MVGYDTILFDLDGTLLDTSEGIINSVKFAEKSMKLPPLMKEDYKKFIGPPPKSMYQSLFGLPKDMALEATNLHREYSAKQGIYEAVPYAGAAECLAVLKREGYKLGVVTLKLECVAVRLIERFNMVKYFDVILGMNGQETLTKAALIYRAREILGSKKVVLVGDSKYDLEGAKETGTDFLAALYGFGFDKRDITYAGLCGYADTPHEILEVICMENKKEMQRIILEAVSEFNETLDVKLDLSAGAETVLWGKDSILESVDFVALIISIEEALSDALGKEISLADSRAMSRQNSPFRTIGALAEYAAEMAGKTNE